MLCTQKINNTTRSEGVVRYIAQLYTPQRKSAVIDCLTRRRNARERNIQLYYDHHSFWAQFHIWIYKPLNPYIYIYIELGYIYLYIYRNIHTHLSLDFSSFSLKIFIHDRSFPFWNTPRQYAPRTLECYINIR